MLTVIGKVQLRVSKKTIHLIAGARPNFIKIAPLYHTLREASWCNTRIVHTGQHYDFNMSEAIFRDLSLPKPDFHLGVGSGTHAQQTGGVMVAYEKLCVEHRPDTIVVVGDVNPTLACALVGAKFWIPVVHLEAGLRSGDRRMPEEINRLMTDSIADLLWTPSIDASENLKKEGVSTDKIELIGNIMIDSFELLRDKIEAVNTPIELNLELGSYGVVTLHRPSNVDHKETLKLILDTLISTSNLILLIFVLHPRTIERLKKYNFTKDLIECARIRLIEPLPYIQFMSLISNAKMIITDSGGIQEETTYLNIPCITLRENTERPVTVTVGTNRLATAENLMEHVALINSGNWPTGACPPLWDGNTAKRAVTSLEKFLT